MKKRVIGKYVGTPNGPLLIVIGGLHGNEIAGVKAIEYVIKMLEVEPITNPEFSLSGTIIGLYGNRLALRQKQRYIDTDLNRLWDDANVKKILSSSTLNNEENELKSLLKSIKYHISRHRPSQIYIMDMHTTSSHGGIFVIPGDEDESLSIAQSTNAPVILGMLDGIQGTTMHYLRTDTLGHPTRTLTFEAGHHDDPRSINRSIAAIINVMRSIQMVNPQDVETIHDNILKQYAADLPKTSRLLYKHEIPKNSEFVMIPGFQNFHAVKKGQVLATQDGYEIKSLHDGILLMPLYQKQGKEGFYIIEEVR